MFMNNFKTKGLIKLHDSMWVTIEPCVVNNRRLGIGTLIVGPDIVNTGLYRGDLKSQDVFVADREHSLYRGYMGDATELCRFLGDDLDGHEWIINGQVVSKDNMCSRMWDTVFLNVRIDDDSCSKHDISQDVIDSLGSNAGFGFNIDMVKPFVGDKNMLKILSTKKREDLADIGSFSVNIDGRYVTYSAVDNVKGLYFVSNSNLDRNVRRQHYDTGNFVWLTKDDISNIHRASKYGIVEDTTGVNDCKINNECLNVLKVINMVHNGVTFGSDEFTKIIGDISLSKAEYDNIKDSIDACNRTLNYTRNYELCYFDYVSVDDDGWDKTQVPHSIYVDSDVLPNGLEVEPFNVVFEEDFCSDALLFRDKEGDEDYDAKCFVLKDINTDIDSEMCYVGDIVTEDGKVIKNVVAQVKDSVWGNFESEMRNIALVSREYRKVGDKIDTKRLENDLGILFYEGASALWRYDGYTANLQTKLKHGIDERPKYNNLKFIPSADGTGAELVSADSKVNIETPEPEIIEVHNDTGIDLE